MMFLAAFLAKSLAFEGEYEFSNISNISTSLAPSPNTWISSEDTFKISDNTFTAFPLFTDLSVISNDLLS